MLNVRVFTLNLFSVHFIFFSCVCPFFLSFFCTFSCPFNHPLLSLLFYICIVLCLSFCLCLAPVPVIPSVSVWPPVPVFPSVSALLLSLSFFLFRSCPFIYDYLCPRTFIKMRIRIQYVNKLKSGSKFLFDHCPVNQNGLFWFFLELKSGLGFSRVGRIRIRSI